MRYNTPAAAAIRACRRIYSLVNTRRMPAFQVVIVATFVAVLPALAPAQEARLDRWMGDLANDAPAAVDQTLAEFILPGTHDSGAYNLKLTNACQDCGNYDKLTGAVAKCKSVLNTVLSKLPGQDPGALDPLCDFQIPALVVPWAATQNRDVFGQLMLGARVFDLRFFEAGAEESGQWSFFFTDPLGGPLVNVGGELTEGEYYAYHTLPGASATSIFDNIKTFLNDPDHSDEILILHFSQMHMVHRPLDPSKPDGQDDNGAEGLAEFFRTLFDSVGRDRFFLRSLGPAAKISTLQAQQPQQIIVVNDSGVPSRLTRSGGDQFIRDRIWTTSAIQTESFSPPGGYPKADNWNTDAKLFAELKALGNKRASTSNPPRMFEMRVPFGVDESDPDKGLMIIRSVLCDIDIGNFSGKCPAVNDDWDSFKSLQEVAAWTNPKILPALMRLPRDQVNIVMTDFYPAELTRDVIKLNKGGVRVQLSIDEIEELECHDCPPSLTPDPDYYPKVTFSNSVEWPNWGGAHLEEDDDPLRPDWVAARIADADTQDVAITMEIWDEDNGDDDRSKIDGNAESITETVPIAPVLPEWTAEWTRSGSEGVTVFDSSRITYSVWVCTWPVCDLVGNTPPTAVLQTLLDIGVLEGFQTVVAGTCTDLSPPGCQPSFDPDPDLFGEIRLYEWDFDFRGPITCTGSPDADCEETRRSQFDPDASSSHGLAAFVPEDGPGSTVVAMRVADGGGERSEIVAREVQIQNLRPSLTALELARSEAAEFSTLPVVVRFDDPGTDDQPFECNVHFRKQGSLTQLTAGGEVTAVGTTPAPESGPQLTHYMCTTDIALGSAGVYDVWARVTDKDGAQSVESVLTELPVVASRDTVDSAGFNPEPALEGQLVTATATFTDIDADGAPFSCLFVLVGDAGRVVHPGVSVVETGEEISPAARFYRCETDTLLLAEGQYELQVNVTDTNNVLTRAVFSVDHEVISLVDVPDLTGQELSSAIAAIAGAGLVPGNVTTANSADVVPDAVISQMPAAGASVNERTLVNLVVSIGPVLTGVPFVIGRTQAAAEAAILAAGLAVGEITKSATSLAPAGSVTTQTPPSGSQSPIGSAVNLVISANPVVSAEIDGAPGSLREVIARVGPGATISFAAELSGKTLVLPSGPLAIDKAVRIGASALPGGIGISGNNVSRVFEIAADTSAVIVNISISEGLSNGPGGCILNDGTLALIGSSVTDCSADRGGAIFNTGTVTMAASTVADSNASVGGCVESSGELTLFRSAVVRCVATVSSGAIHSTGGLTATNSTVAASRAPQVGGVWNAGDATVTYTTIAGNHSTNAGSAALGGGYFQDTGGSLSVDSSIFAGNTSDIAPDVSWQGRGTLTSPGPNLIGVNESAESIFPAGVLVGTRGVPRDPELGPLTDNGGGTESFLPLVGSPAINAASLPMVIDQRGVFRPGGTLNDLGAVERSPADNVAPVVNAGPNGELDEGATFASAGSFSDPDSTAWTASVDYGDGSGEQPLAIESNNAFELEHTYVDDGIYTVTVTVSDDSSGQGTATATVTVNAVNTPPVLSPIGDKNVDAGATLTFAATAIDTDVPANALTFSLDTGAPAGAGIDPTSGLFAWTPDGAAGPGPFQITVRVRDDGVPSLSDSETISVTISGAQPGPGDIDGDGDVDIVDVQLLLAARGEPATGADDPRDLDGDGVISVVDARTAVLLCTLPRCASPG